MFSDCQKCTLLYYVLFLILFTLLLLWSNLYALRPFQWPHYLLIKKTKCRLDSLVVDIIAECTLKTKAHLLNILSESAAIKGYYWSFARRWFELHTKLNQTDQKNVNGSQEKIEDSQEKVEDSQDEESSQSEQLSSQTQVSKSESDEGETLDVTLDVENIKDIITGSGFFHTWQVNIHIIFSFSDPNLS